MSMSPTDFIHRITQTFFYGGYKDLERIMQHQVLRNEMDFGEIYPHPPEYLLIMIPACATLLVSDPTVRLLSITRGDDEYLAIWPLCDGDHSVQDIGDRLVYALLHEVGWTKVDLYHMVEANTPGFEDD